MRPPSDLSAGMGENGRASVGLAVLCLPIPFTPSFTPRSWESEGNLRMLPSVPGSRCRLLFRSGAAVAAESFCRLGFSVSLPSTSESRGSKPPKPQSASESQPSPASSLGSASSNDRIALKGPKSDLDEGGEDDRVSVPPSIRASSAGVGRSERTSMGLAEFTLFAFPSSSFLFLQILGIRGRPKSVAGRPMISSSCASP